MRLVLRFALAISILITILLLLLKNILEDLWDQYSVSAYLQHSWKNSFQHGTVQNIPALHGEAGDQVIIMAKMEKENTNWVAEMLPEYVHELSSEG